jgi:hypothetical protein
VVRVSGAADPAPVGLRRRPGRLTWSELRLLLEALAWLAVMRIGVALLSFKRLARLAGCAPGERHRPLRADELALVRRIGWAVRAAAPRAPWQSLCLAQGLATATMLRRCRLPGTLYLGVAKSGDDTMQAHAWLRCGDDVLTGDAGHRRFAVVLAYSW